MEEISTKCRKEEETKSSEFNLLKLFCGRLESDVSLRAKLDGIGWPSHVEKPCVLKKGSQKIATKEALTKEAN